MEKINFLDGSTEEQTKALKEFCGLSPEQSFQEIVIDDEDTDETA